MSDWNPDHCCKQPDDCKWGGTGPCDVRVYDWLRAHGWRQDPALPSGLIGTRLWRSPDAMTLTLFTIVRTSGGLVGIQCPVCSRISFNRNDVAQKYCGACKQFLVPDGTVIPS